MKNHLLVVGSVALDTVKTRAGKKEDIIGGAATFISLSAASFCTPRLVGIIGEGDFPKEDIALLEKCGVNLKGLVEEPGRTFRWSGVYADDFSTRETLSTELGVFETFNPVIPQEYKDSQFVMLGNIHPALQLSVLDQIDSNAFVAADTMNLWIDTTREDLDKLISRVNLLFINDEEAFMLTGERQIRVAAKKLLEKGLDALVIKRGEHGAFLFAKDTLFYTPAIPLEDVIDPTGAGDTFAGGFMGYLAQQGSATGPVMKKAMLYGTAMASAQVQGFGAEGLMTLHDDKIEKRINEIIELTNVGV